MAIKIFIDQGHNPFGVNAGAEASGVREQDVNYEVGKILADLLASNPEFEVRLSRPEENTSLGSTNSESLALRARGANEWGADWFVSIHSNSSTSSSASGCEGYVYSASSRAYPFAESILNGIERYTGLSNRGVFVRPSLYVLRATSMPATLIELGYLTNSNDLDLLVNSPDAFANGMYFGILEFFGLL